MSALTLTYSLADQEFDRTKSLGVLNVSLELTRRLAQRPEIARLRILANSSLAPQLPVSSRVDITSHDEAMRGGVGRLLWDQFGVYRMAKRAGNDLLFLPKGFAPFTQPPPVPLVTYVHDTMFSHYEAAYPGGFPLLERTYFAACFRATLKYSSLILTNSDFTASEIRAAARARQASLPPIVTVGIGVSPEPPPGAVEKQERLVVLASSLPHKRTALALEYLTEWTMETGFSGGIDWIGALPRGYVLPPFRGWRLHSRIPDPQYKALVGTARALVYFSDYEGFGMPPVEAVALGTAPVYSSIPATREVMAGAGHAFDNASFESFSVAIAGAMATGPDVVQRWAADLLARHNWDAVVDRVAGALVELTAGHAGRAGGQEPLRPQHASR